MVKQVDTKDLKSFEHCVRVGSNPTISTKYNHICFINNINNNKLIKKLNNFPSC